MSHRKIMFGLSLSAVVGFGAAYVPSLVARADNKPAAAPAAAAPTCKLHGKKCCDPAIMAHLPKDAVFKACGESDATFLGEDGGEKDTCKYFFKVDGREGRRHLRPGLRAGAERGPAGAERSVLRLQEGRQGLT